MRRLAVLGVSAAGAFAVAAVVWVSGAGAQSPLGPCDEGWVAPSPTEMAVTGVPIVVASTVDDYFVLYVKHERYDDTFWDVPVLVARGEAGTTTLSDNLVPLPADRYRVHRYQVADPADIDGDCVDDITELDQIGVHNPTNAANTTVGRPAIESREAFELLSYRHRYIRGLSAKFWILHPDSRSPEVHFMDTRVHWPHNAYKRAMGWGDDDVRGAMTGFVVWLPDAFAADGSQGVYRFFFSMGLTYGFWDVAYANEILAAAMPFLENNLSYSPAPKARNPWNSYPIDPALSLYEQQKVLFDGSRVDVLLEDEIPSDAAYVPLNVAGGFGLLRVLGAGERPGARDVVVLDYLPNDIPRVAGVITTVRQTPLAHVNLRAIQDGVPNAFVRNALDRKAIADLVGKHVYFETRADGFTLRAATKAEVESWHESSRPAAVQTLVRDLSVTGIRPLEDVGFADRDAFGAKAANVAVLSEMGELADGVAPEGFAVPFYFYDEFMKQATVSGETVLGKKKGPDSEKITLAAGTSLADAVSAMLAHPRFVSDFDVQEEMLDDLRKAIKKATAPAWIVTALENMHASYPDGTSLRYRSSTNNEDLPGFSGAGLYDSKTQDPEETAEDGIDKSIKAVWASLWNFRAFAEREFHRIDHPSAAMGVLVHPNYSDELANGVAVSFDPVTGIEGVFYVNTQMGEDLVTNPEAGSFPEQILLGPDGKATVLARSNLAQDNKLFLDAAQLVELRGALDAIHSSFKVLYGVGDGERFAMEIEFKITAEDSLAIKQARPWVFSDPLTLVTAAFDAAEFAEGLPLSLTLTRTAGYLGKPLTVGLAWSETADMLDGAALPTTATFAAGEETVTVAAPTVADAAAELDSTVTVTVSTGSGYMVSSSQGAATVVVSDVVGPLPAVFAPDAALVAAVAARADAHSNAAAAERLRRVVKGMRGEPGGYTAAECRDTAEDYGVLGTWGPWCDEIERRENWTPPPPTLEVSISAGQGVTEGGTAVFTLTATPVPASDLDVTVQVSQSGAFGVTTGARTVTVGTSGTATLSVATVDDGTDETDGSVTAALASGSGYTVSSSSGAASVGVADDDVPEVSISGGSGVAEGGSAVFTLTASPAPASALPVRVSIDQSGDFGVSIGTRTVTVDASGTATLAVATSGDDADEPDGSVTATLATGSGYAVSSSSGSASVAVADDDHSAPAVFVPDAALVAAVSAKADAHSNAAAAERLRRIVKGMRGETGGYTAKECRDTARHHGVGSTWKPWCDEIGRRENSQATTPVPTPPPTPEVSISAGAGVTEGGAAVFTLTAAPAPASPLTVNVTIGQQGDYGVVAGSRTVTVGTSGTASLSIATTGDSADEPDGSVTATISTGTGYDVSSSNGAATVVVSDDDDPPPPPPTPEVSISAGAGVTEGGAAVFTLTAAPAPASPLTVNVTIGQQGDYGVVAGSRTVTVGTSGTASLSIPTTGDDTDEPDGSVTVTLAAGSGYDVSGGRGSATVAVSDDDDPPVPDPDPVPPGDAIASDAEALELARAEQARLVPLRNGSFDLWTVHWRLGFIIDALEGADSGANSAHNGWYLFRNTLINAVSAGDAAAVDALTRLGDWFITRYGLIIDAHNLGYDTAWPTL